MELTNLVNVNTATPEELITVPGIGPALADRILELRPFQSLEDLARVRGISANTVDDLRAYLTLNSMVDEPAMQLSEDDVAQSVDVLDGQVMELSELEEATAQPDFAEKAEFIEPEPVLVELSEPTKASAEMAMEKPQEKPQEKTAEKPQEKQDAKPKEKVVEVEKVQSSGVSRNELMLYSAGFAVISIFLAVIISLGILAAVNASLNYPTEAQFITLQRSFDDLSSQATVLQQDVASLRTRMDNLDALSGRVGDLEKQTESILITLDETNRQLVQVGDQVAQLDERTGKLEQDVATFNRFLDGLRALLSDVMAEPVTK